jgi:hypothetical protein
MYRIGLLFFNLPHPNDFVLATHFALSWDDGE